MIGLDKLGQSSFRFARTLGATYAVLEVKGITYKIIGGDGREYGPVALDELRTWIVGERIGRATRIWSSDDACWIPAGERAELVWDLPPETAPPPPVLASMAVARYALPLGFGRDGSPVVAALLPRIAAIIFDYILFTFASRLLTAPWAQEMDDLAQMTLASLRKGESDPTLTLALLRQFLISVVPISCAYYALLPLLLGGTPGKLLVGIRVVQTDGSALSWPRAVVRWLGALACVMTFGLGFLPLFFTPRRQSLPDLVAGTCVTYTPPR